MGVVLAGGLGSRLGGEGKATVEVAGRPLLSYALEAMTGALDEVVVAAKATTALPGTRSAGSVHVPGSPRDMPLVTPALVATIAMADAGGALAVVPLTGTRLQPLLARYEPGRCRCWRRRAMA